MTYKGSHRPVPFYSVRKIGIFNWQWAIYDRMLGPLMAGPGRAFTESRARKALQAAAAKLKAQGLS